MVEKQDAGKAQSIRDDAARRAEEGVPVERATKSTQAAPVTPARPRPRWRQRLAIGVLAALVLAAIWKFGVPWIELTLNTVSTDDAYVNDHVTFVAARVSGQVSRVLVDDNNRVRKGDLLVELDKEPFQDAVAVSQAAVDTAQAELGVAKATVRGFEAQAMSARWKVQRAVEDVDNQVALLHARVATVDKSKADLALAQVDFERAEKLVQSN